MVAVADISTRNIKPFTAAVKGVAALFPKELSVLEHQSSCTIQIMAAVELMEIVQIFYHATSKLESRWVLLCLQDTIISPSRHQDALRVRSLASS